MGAPLGAYAKLAAERVESLKVAPRGGVGERVSFAKNVGNEEVVAEGFYGGGVQYCLKDVLHEGRLCGFPSEGMARGEGVDFRDDCRALRCCGESGVASGNLQKAPPMTPATPASGAPSFAASDLR
eukprot:2244406-Pleurochrysis_carterae.AAC.2